MEKSEVIKLRETLRKTGSKQNTPLRIFSNNSFTIIDESLFIDNSERIDMSSIMNGTTIINNKEE